MNKETIKKELTEKHKEFVDYIDSLSDNDFLNTKNNQKWSAGQHLEHIYLSVRPVNLALLFPKIFIRLLYGKPSNTRTYKHLVNDYQKVLKNGGKAGALYIPKSVSISKKQNLINNLTKLVVVLNRKIDKLSEADLDTHILPHPLIGKTTIREMLYFTIYHVQHHQKAIKENLN
jgi:uncharacterized damage-inducible protein DinB